jgi:hypothetical protein
VVYVPPCLPSHRSCTQSPFLTFPSPISTALRPDGPHDRLFTKEETEEVVFEPNPEYGASAATCWIAAKRIADVSSSHLFD